MMRCVCVWVMIWRRLSAFVANLFISCLLKIVCDSECFFFVFFSLVRTNKWPNEWSSLWAICIHCADPYQRLGIRKFHLWLTEKIVSIANSLQMVDMWNGWPYSSRCWWFIFILLHKDARPYICLIILLDGWWRRDKRVRWAISYAHNFLIKLIKIKHGKYERRVSSSIQHSHTQDDLVIFAYSPHTISINRMCSDKVAFVAK